ncbi:MAG: aldolase [Parvibaculum sp.]|uniref:HPr kinase/phosphorylase n=1 Tax=Parvibaculum sp. TaxID=2024848 RepID=UPI003C74E335
MTTPTFVHGTCVALGGKGVLLRGRSGTGKSDLAFRLIRGRGDARLVADDQVGLVNEAGRLVARAPAALAGLLELRGLGLVTMPTVSHIEVAIIVDLVPRDDVPRLPEPQFARLCGVELPLLALHGFDLTAVDKVGLALDLIPGRGFPGDDGRLGDGA